MRCKNCNVDIACKATKCPLCHQPLISEGEVAFPSPQPKKRVVNRFLRAYALLAAFVILLCVALNVVVDVKLLWCIPVAVALCYGYYLLGVILVSKRRWHKHIMGQMLAHTLAFVIVRLTLPTEHAFYSYWLPVIYVVSDGMILVFFLKTGAEAPKYLSTVLFLFLLGACPTIFAFVFRLAQPIPSYVATGIGVAVFVTLSVVFRKSIKYELKKTFHS